MEFVFSSKQKERLKLNGEKMKEEGQEKKSRFSREGLKKILRSSSKTFAERVILPALLLFPSLRALSQEKRMEKLQDLPLSPRETEISGQERKRESIEIVKARAILSTLNNKYLIQEHGEKIVKEIAACLEQYSFEEINNILARLSGLKKEEISQDKPALLYLVSHEEAKESNKLSQQFGGLPLISDWAGMVWPNDRIYLITDNFVQGKKNDKGKGTSKLEKSVYQNQKLQKDLLLHVLTHEYLHVLTTSFSLENKKHKIEFPAWTIEENLPHIFYEGATELIATLISQEKKEKCVHGYQAATLASYLISRIVGEEDFIKDYLRGEKKLIQAAWDDQFGEGSFEKLMNDPQLYLNPHHGEALLKKIITFFAKQGYDIGPWQSRPLKRESGKNLFSMIVIMESGSMFGENFKNQ